VHVCHLDAWLFKEIKECEFVGYKSKKASFVTVAALSIFGAGDVHC
jgi:hypothetical protein